MSKEERVDLGNVRGSKGEKGQDGIGIESITDLGYTDSDKPFNHMYAITYDDHTKLPTIITVKDGENLSLQNTITSDGERAVPSKTIWSALQNKAMLNHTHYTSQVAQDNALDTIGTDEYDTQDIINEKIDEGLLNILTTLESQGTVVKVTGAMNSIPIGDRKENRLYVKTKNTETNDALNKTFDLYIWKDNEWVHLDNIDTYTKTESNTRFADKEHFHTEGEIELQNNYDYLGLMQGDRQGDLNIQVDELAGYIQNNLSVDNQMSDTRTNPVQNKVVKAYIDTKINSATGSITSGDTVTFNRTLNDGTKIGTITINGAPTDIYSTNDTTYSNATISSNGLMSKEDKAKLDKSLLIPYGVITSDTRNANGTNQIYSLTIDSNISLTDGTLIMVTNKVEQNFSASKLNVNNLGPRNIYHNGSLLDNDEFKQNNTYLLLYTTSIVSAGCWVIVDTDTEYTNGTGLTLNNNNSFSVNYGTTSNTACEGNDSRLSDTRNPKSTKITSGDLNDYTSTGFYYCNSNTQAESILNRPSKVKAFYLQVENWGSANNVKQTISSYHQDAPSPFIYVRTKNGDNVWSNWRQIHTYDEPKYLTAEQTLTSTKNGIERLELSDGYFFQNKNTDWVITGHIKVSGEACRFELQFPGNTDANNHLSVGKNTDGNFAIWWSISSSAEQSHVDANVTFNNDVWYDFSILKRGNTVTVNFNNTKQHEFLPTYFNSLEYVRPQLLKWATSNISVRNLTIRPHLHLPLTDVATTIDYNDYKKEGHYLIWNAQQSNTNQKNAPDTQGGLLTVEIIPNGVKQTLTQYYVTNPKTFYRIYHTTNGWRNWKEIITDDYAESTSSNIKMNGTVSAGSSKNYARSDHIHPSDTSKASSTHTHGNITNDGKIGTATGKLITTGTNGVLQAVDSITKSKISDFAHTNATGSSVGQASSSVFGHAKATSTAPTDINTYNSVGTDNGLYARGDHRHKINTISELSYYDGSYTLEGHQVLDGFIGEEIYEKLKGLEWKHILSNNTINYYENSIMGCLEFTGFKQTVTVTKGNWSPYIFKLPVSMNQEYLNFPSTPVISPFYNGTTDLNVALTSNGEVKVRCMSQNLTETTIELNCSLMWRI